MDINDIIKYVDGQRDFVIDLYRGFIPIKAWPPKTAATGSGIGLITYWASLRGTSMRLG